MLLAGDEFGHSQGGNNNAYAQDNETSWLDWSCRDEDREFTDAVRALIALRRNWSVFRQLHHVHNHSGPSEPAMHWYHPDGSLLAGDDWSHASALMLVITNTTQVASVLLNGATESFDFHPPGDHWAVVFASTQPWPQPVNDSLALPAHSCACLVNTLPSEVQRRLASQTRA
jgi:glycogen operon protein